MYRNHGRGKTNNNNKNAKERGIQTEHVQDEDAKDGSANEVARLEMALDNKETELITSNCLVEELQHRVQQS